MTSRTRVYQFGLLPPTVNAPLVRAQLRAAHDYANELVMIERGRRAALRALDDTPEVAEAAEALKAATKSTRKALMKALNAARKEARSGKQQEQEFIAECDARLRKDARALTPCFWGSYLTIEASADQSRKMPLYDDDALTPSDPRFHRWTGVGQIGVQLQNGMASKDVHAGLSRSVLLPLPTRVHEARVGKRRRGSEKFTTLSLRVGTTGRDPIWAEFPLVMHRSIPDDARWKWVRVSCRRVGTREVWTCEVTLELQGEAPRTLDKELEGAIAVEVEWGEVAAGGEKTLRAASWRDTRGGAGVVILPPRIPQGFEKANGIRAVRDMLTNDMRPKLAEALRTCKEPKPPWLLEAERALLLWKSPERYYRLVQRWRGERCDVAREAYDLLQAWELRDAHLWDYEAGQRRRTLYFRRDFYRNLAQRWAQQYRHVILDDRDLSREARWGEDSDLRFAAAPFELRQMIRNVFEGGVDASTFPMPKKGAESETEERDWCEQALDAWKAGGGGGGGNLTPVAVRATRKGGAWASRKEKKKETARETASNSVEG